MSERTRRNIYSSFQIPCRMVLKDSIINAKLILTNANLTNANLIGADLESANLESADLESAHLTRANLTRANLESAYLANANLESANLANAYLGGADLRGANLTNANLDFTSLPLWCGGTRLKLDRHISLQLIYHTFNQIHDDPAIRAALEPLRPLADEFRSEYRKDAPELRKADSDEL